jgi:hypothetical protein
VGPSSPVPRGLGLPRRSCLLAIAVTSLLSSATLAQIATGSVTRGLQLDAGPSTGSAPDPLAPPEVVGPAPAAPGAPPAAAETAPVENADPIALLVRQRLTASPSRGGAGERDDLVGLTAFNAAAGEPI